METERSLNKQPLLTAKTITPAAIFLFLYMKNPEALFENTLDTTHENINIIFLNFLASLYCILARCCI